MHSKHHPIAVIDLGTNTFHMLIVEPTADGRFVEKFRERRFVKLAQEGIEYIGPSAWQRGMESMQDFRQIMDQWNVQEVRACGTAALRTAENGAQFIETVFKKTGIQIQLIDGYQEAAYILKGVRLAIPFEDNPFLVMDVGGGSVEFMIADASKVYWMQSFPIGVAVLYRKFHRQEPISDQEVLQLNQFLDEQLTPLREALAQYPVSRFIGVAGTFDVLENMLAVHSKHSSYTELDISDFPNLLEYLRGATLDERLHYKGMPPFRADMIVVANLLIDYILALGQFGGIWVSHFDLKEGMAAELLE